MNDKAKYALTYSKRGFIFLEKYERELYFGQEKKKDLKSAIFDYTEAIRLDPCESGFYLNRAAAYDLLNESENAFADACQAIELENPPNKINLINRGIAYAIKDDWHHAFEDFNRADKLEFSKHPNNIENIETIEKLRNRYHRRFLDLQGDEFYIILRQFTEENGMDIFNKKNSYALLSDFLKNEYKKDLLLFHNMVERKIHKEIMETKQLEETRKIIIDKIGGLPVFQGYGLNRMIDIIFCLAQNEDFFQQRGQIWERLLTLN